MLVSIGYSACHWCHVMERESFEDEETARIMNEHFVNIKIDREERPDLDHIYMDAVQAMTGSGGWPLNVFLTPSGKPFFGGTYFPPQRAFNRPSWKEILHSVSEAFENRRHEIDAQAESMTEHLLQSNSFGLQKSSGENDENSRFEKEDISESFQNIMKQADKEWGGFGRAPKFPQSFVIQFLLRYHYLAKNEEALKQACLSLDKMIEGGIYDQVGGGFARYSTDNEWLAPHFEKMLYDNALLISVLSEAFQVTKNERYREVIDETITFVNRELSHPEGGFYCALDADSEGEEGKFYVWDYEQVIKLLGGDAELFCGYFDISPGGNWEGKNILRVKEKLEKFALKENIPYDELKGIIDRGREKLLTEREKRPRPSLDDKIILGWNSLMTTALCKAFAATGNEMYKVMAEGNMNFLLKNFKRNEQGLFYHTWKNGQGKHPAFLDDYAFLIQALLQLHEITADTGWLLKAKQSCVFVLENFSEKETGFFFYTHKDQEDVILRKKEVYDGALPSGNSVMAFNLLHLSILFDDPAWKQRVYGMVAGLIKAIVRYPSSFGIWSCLLQELVYDTIEISIVGKEYFSIQKEALSAFIPNKVLMCSPGSNNEFPLLVDKPATDMTLIYVCKNFSCRAPVFTVQELLYLISLENG